jgi:hypothetical protein
MTPTDLLTAMQIALVDAYPDDAWLVRDFGRLVKVELIYGTHTLSHYVSWPQARARVDVAVLIGQKLLEWRESTAT